jgi:GNAT superfamily N-acetyltransferase
MTFAVRTAVYEDAKDIAHVHVESWKAAYKGVVHQSYLDNGLDKETRRKRWEDSFEKVGDHYEIYIALDDGRTIGFADVGVSRDEDKKDYAELYAIYLDPAYYGQGAGRLLFNECRQKTKKMNYKKLFVWVLEGNKIARDFYERMGAVLSDHEKVVSIDGKNYREIAYEWTDLA